MWSFFFPLNITQENKDMFLIITLQSDNNTWLLEVKEKENTLECNGNPKKLPKTMTDNYDDFNDRFIRFHTRKKLVFINQGCRYCYEIYFLAVVITISGYDGFFLHNLISEVV